MQQNRLVVKRIEKSYTPPKIVASDSILQHKIFQTQTSEITTTKKKSKGQTV